VPLTLRAEPGHAEDSVIAKGSSAPYVTLIEDTRFSQEVRCGKTTSDRDPRRVGSAPTPTARPLTARNSHPARRPVARQGSVGGGTGSTKADRIRRVTLQGRCAVLLATSAAPHTRRSGASVTAVETLLGLFAFLVLTAIYFIPSMVAVARKRQLASVIVINIFLGWTLIGWVVALALAASSGNNSQQVSVVYPPGYLPQAPPPGPFAPQPPGPFTPQPWEQNPTPPQQYWQGQPPLPSADPWNPNPPSGPLPPS
jgi:hypothetical protein